MSGKVTKGFGRGSKQLGIPTANLPSEVAEWAGKELGVTGIYFGYAKLGENIYEMVMSSGWNPYYKNEKRSVEVHLLHEFDQDFYGEMLQVLVLGFIRPEQDYSSVEALIEDIHTDIAVTHKSLERSSYRKFSSQQYFE